MLSAHAAELIILTWTAHLPALWANIWVTIVHTNDVHSHFTESDPTGRQCTDEQRQAGVCVGGVSRHYSFVNHLRKSAQHLLFLNAGDYFQGTQWFSALDESSIARMIATLKHDAMTLGTHEFDHGPKGLNRFISALRNTTKVLVCNIDTRKEPLVDSSTIEQSTVLQLDANTQIGIIGYITPNSRYQSVTGRVEFSDDKDCVQREAQRLKDQHVNIIIAVGHSGLTRDREIAYAVPEVGVIVGGYSHSFLYSGAGTFSTPEKSEGPYPVVVQRQDSSICLVAHAFWFGKYVGVLNVLFDNDGKVLNFSGQPVLMDRRIRTAPDSFMEIIIKNLSTVSDHAMGTKVGETKVLLEGTRQVCRLEECTLGNLVTDAMFGWFADLRTSEDNRWSRVNGAVVQGSDIRASIDDRITQGNILLEHLYEVLGEDAVHNAAFIVEIKGSVFTKMLEHAVKGYDFANKKALRDFLQVAGIRVTYNVRSAPLRRVAKLSTLCTRCRVPAYEDVQPTETYRLVVLSTLLNAPHMESLLLREDIIPTGVTILEILKTYIGAKSPMKTMLENRIVITSSARRVRNSLFLAYLWAFYHILMHTYHAECLRVPSTILSCA